MAGVAGFFNSTRVLELKQTSSSVYINVGGDQFHALAAALMDVFKSFSRTGDGLAKKILGPLYLYFPKYMNSQPYLTPSERFNLLLKNFRPTELIDSFAYVLRQMAVDEMEANPLNYRDVYTGFEDETPKKHLRESSTKLPRSCLHALADALGIMIHLSVVEQGKELRQKIVYSTDLNLSATFEVSLQQQEEHYFPRIKDKVYFAYAGQLALAPVKPAIQPGSMETIAGIRRLIAEDNKRLAIAFAQTKKTLCSMVDAGELSKEQMMGLYVEFLPTQYASACSMDFIDSSADILIHQPINGVATEGPEQHMVYSLIDGVAKWIISGQINADAFFNRLENLESKKSIAKLGE